MTSRSANLEIETRFPIEGRSQIAALNLLLALLAALNVASVLVTLIAQG
jgi:hypothetical protein